MPITSIKTQGYFLLLVVVLLGSCHKMPTLQHSQIKSVFDGGPFKYYTQDERLSTVSQLEAHISENYVLLNIKQNKERNSLNPEALTNNNLTSANNASEPTAAAAGQKKYWP